jgi:hypothetical protein
VHQARQDFDIILSYFLPRYDEKIGGWETCPRETWKWLMAKKWSLPILEGRGRMGYNAKRLARGMGQPSSSNMRGTEP